MSLIAIAVVLLGAVSTYAADLHRLNELEDLVVRDLYGESVENVWIDVKVRGEVTSSLLQFINA
jgi:hypothetical protein